MLYKCPFCDTLKRKFSDIKQHIKDQHEDRDHWALWVKEIDTNNRKWITVP